MRNSTSRGRRFLIGFWKEVRRLLLLITATGVAALGYSLFQVPYNIAAGGVSGIGIIVHHFTGFSPSLFYLLANIPLLAGIPNMVYGRVRGMC